MSFDSSLTKARYRVYLIHALAKSSVRGESLNSLWCKRTLTRFFYAYQFMVGVIWGVLRLAAPIDAVSQPELCLPPNF
jgi:hypothetical protein